MSKLIIILAFIIVPNISIAQENSDESKPSAAVSVVKAISDSFLPGVFSGITSIIDDIEVKKKKSQEEQQATNDKLSEAKSEIETLKATSSSLRQRAITTLTNLNEYYEAESRDFSTINEFYLKVSIFSTKVHMLVGISDVMTDTEVSYCSDNAKIIVINRFKEAAREVTDNFDVDESKFVSDNKTLNADILNQKRIIDAVIRRIKGSDLTDNSTTIMSTSEVNDFYNLVTEIKEKGAHNFADLEKAVIEIQTLLGSYLKDFSKKTDKINKNINNIIEEMKTDDK